MAAKINASDNPRWHEAMNGPDRAGYWEAMKAELSTLTKLKAWTVVSLTPDMNVLDSTWASSVKDILMGTFKSSNQGFAAEVTSKSMERTTLIPLLQSSHGLQFEFYLCFQ